MDDYQTYMFLRTKQDLLMQFIEVTLRSNWKKIKGTIRIRKEKEKEEGKTKHKHGRQFKICLHKVSSLYQKTEEMF